MIEEACRLGSLRLLLNPVYVHLSNRRAGVGFVVTNASSKLASPR